MASFGLGFLVTLFTIAICVSLISESEVEAARRIMSADISGQTTSSSSPLANSDVVDSHTSATCSRDIDCEFQIPCSGLKLCNEGICDCVGGPISSPSQTSSSSSRLANSDVVDSHTSATCSRDIDCEFQIPCSGLKLCNDGICDCVGRPIISSPSQTSN